MYFWCINLRLPIVWDWKIVGCVTNDVQVKSYLSRDDMIRFQTMNTFLSNRHLEIQVISKLIFGCWYRFLNIHFLRLIENQNMNHVSLFSAVHFLSLHYCNICATRLDSKRHRREANRTSSLISRRSSGMTWHIKSIAPLWVRGIHT